MAFEPGLEGWVGFQLEGMDGIGMPDDGNSMGKTVRGESTGRGAEKQIAERALSRGSQLGRAVVASWRGCRKGVKVSC